MELESAKTLEPGHEYEAKPQATKGKATALSPGLRILRISNTLLILSVVIALISLVVLYKKNTQLQQERLSLISNPQTISGKGAGLASAQVGDLLPSFDTRGFDGTQFSVVYDGKSKYAFFIFSPECGECVSEFSTWRRLAPEISSRAYRVVGLSTYSEAGSEEKQGAVDLNFEAFRIPSMAIQRAYRVVGVPMVMLVSGEGKVEWVHTGRLPEEKINDLLSKIDGEKQ